MERKRRSKRFLWLVMLALAGLGALASLRVGPQPTVRIDPELPGIGRRTPVAVSLGADGRGLDRVRVFLDQGGRRELLAEKTYRPRPAWAFWGERATHDRVELEVGGEVLDWLAEGEATLMAEASAAGTWLRNPDPARAQTTLPVLLRPPALGVVSSQHYPAQGGCEVVVYRVGSTSVKDGVQVGDLWFPGAPVAAAGKGERMALFAVPFDHPDASSIRLRAEDAVGNSSTVAFVDRFISRDFKTDDIEVSEAFMAKVVPEIQAKTPGLPDRGGLVENYVAINRDLRQRNGETLSALAESSVGEFLWNEVFLPMPNAQVMSAFADRRTYLHDGREIDRQDHLGFDLASVKRAPIPAANDGVVALAEYFGIYGNAVVIDHGLGLMSLYGHLSSIDVEPGQPVKRGQVVGRSGETGLAAGDHLHFTMLLRGLAVNPVEWWDAGWIRNRLERKLAPSFTLGG